MSNLIVAKGETYAGRSFIVSSQVLNPNTRQLLLQADLSTLVYTAVDTAGSVIGVYENVSLTVADVVYDTLQTSEDDKFWTHADSGRGYNFSFNVPGACAPTEDASTEIRVIATPSSGNSFEWRYLVTAR